MADKYRRWLSRCAGPARNAGRPWAARGNQSMLAGLAPIRASAGAAGCRARARRRRAPDTQDQSVFDVFLLLSFGSYVPAPASSSPSVPPGPAARAIGSGAPASLISSRRLHVPGPSGGQGLRRAQLRKLRQQPKNNRGEGKLAGHLTAPRPPDSSAKGATP
jgi:hypothetical protein